LLYLIPYVRKEEGNPFGYFFSGLHFLRDGKERKLFYKIKANIQLLLMNLLKAVCQPSGALSLDH